MPNIDIIRAWKDAKYRRSLTPEQLALVPENPAGMVELTDDQLKLAGGLSGGAGGPMTTAWNCTLYSFGTWHACGCGIPTTSITCTMFSWQGWLACCPA